MTMKNFKLLLALLLLTAAGVSAQNATARKYNQAEKAARAYVEHYLADDQKLPTRIDESDESLAFQAYEGNDQVLYWIEFDGNAQNMRYTLHRKRIDVLNKEKEYDPREKNRILEIARLAAHNMTANGPISMYVNGNRVDAQIISYASTPEEYCKTLPRIVREISGANKTFHDKYYQPAISVVDSIHGAYYNIDPKRKVMPQALAADTMPTTIKVTDLALRSVDEDGGPLVNYGKPLRTINTQFIIPRLTVVADEPGQYVVGLKMLDPKGRVIVSNPDDDFTMYGLVNVSKKEAKAPVEVELGKFGTTAVGAWTPGTYTVCVYQNGNLIKKTLVEIAER